MKTLTRIVLTLAVACMMSVVGTGCSGNQCCTKECAADCKKACAADCKAACCKDKHQCPPGCTKECCKGKAEPAKS